MENFHRDRADAEIEPGEFDHRQIEIGWRVADAADRRIGARSNGSCQQHSEAAIGGTRQRDRSPAEAAGEGGVVA
jgi:hypothetical protein